MGQFFSRGAWRVFSDYMTTATKPIDKFEAAMLRIREMDKIDARNGFGSPAFSLGIALEAINAGIAMMKQGRHDEGEEALYESAIYFHLAGFAEAKEWK